MYQARLALRLCCMRSLQLQSAYVSSIHILATAQQHLPKPAQHVTRDGTPCHLSLRGSSVWPWSPNHLSSISSHFRKKQACACLLSSIAPPHNLLLQLRPVQCAAPVAPRNNSARDNPPPPLPRLNGINYAMMVLLPVMPLARQQSTCTPAFCGPAGRLTVRRQAHARRVSRLAANAGPVEAASSSPSRGVVILPGLGNAAGDYAAIAGVHCCADDGCKLPAHKSKQL